ncbi:MAG: hypothetical protein KTR35_09580 [Gammaproteobacteria bacterium]|nr:hypothetical protein [Gammaproteobacteria bacterium]
MIANQNNLYFIALLCLLPLFIASIVYLRRRDKSTWRVLILLSGALLVAVLIGSRFLFNGDYEPALFAPGLGVAAAALIGLLVATLFGPQKNSSLPALGQSHDTALLETQTSGISSTAQNSSSSTMHPDLHPASPLADGAVSLVELNADLDSELDNSRFDQYSDIDEAMMEKATDTEGHSVSQQNFHTIVGTSQPDSNSTTRDSELEQSLDDSDTDKVESTLPSNSEDQPETPAPWKAPVTSLHERRAPERPEDWNTMAGASRDEDSLDLGETERLFQEMRDDIQGVDLPDNDQWLAEASIVDDAQIDENHLADESDEPITDIADSIMDAEFVDEDEALDPDATLSFGDDLTGEYARPESDDIAIASLQTETAEEEYPLNEPAIPQTLEEAMVAAKRSASELENQVVALQDGLESFNNLRDQEYMDASRTQLLQADALIQRENLLQVEAQTHHLQESVVDMQRTLLKKTARRQQLVSALLKQERRRLSIQQEEIEKARRMAKQAALAARKAASAQQTMLDVARREQQARIKAQASAKKAMEIAKNAINALNSGRQQNGTHY